MNTSENSTSSENSGKHRLKPIVRIPLFILLGLGVIVLTVFLYRYFAYRVSTDDAQIDGDIIPVVSRVSAYVDHIGVNENDRVSHDQLLLKLDTTDLANTLAQEKSALQQAKNQLKVAQLQLNGAEIDLKLTRQKEKNAKAANWKAQNDFQRKKTLYQKKILTQDAYNVVKLTAEQSANDLRLAELELSKAQLQITELQQQIKDSKQQIVGMELKLMEARNNLSYAFVKSPTDGYIANKQVKPGQFVQGGQLLFNVISSDSVWVTAQFKETQLRFLTKGREVNVEVDAYPHRNFIAIVESIAPASESKFALIAPSNASGNFVKVVQRFSVRLRFEEGQDLPPLAPGMNVNVVFYK